MMQLNVTPDFKKRSLKFKPEFPAAAKLESVELVIPNPDGEIKTAGLSFIIYSARCGGRKLAVCDAFTGTGTITGTLNLCTDRMVDEFYHLPLGTRRSFHAVLWSEADQWMIGAGRIAIANNPGSDSMNPAPLPADRYPTFEEVEEMIRNSGGLDEPVVRRVNGIAPDNAGNVSITIPGDVSELKDKDGLTLTVQQKNTLATLSTTYASKNHTHSEYALKSELPDVSGFITADKLNLYQLKADAFSGKYADLSGKPSAFPPASHTHAVADVNGLADELSRKLTVPAGGNAGQFLMKTVSGCGWSSIDLASYITITQARNEFAAKTHEHSQYALASALQDYAAKVHTHIIGDVTGLQDALDGKAAADHNHDSVYAPKEATAAALNAKLTIPAGGTAGQVIGKTSDGYGWITVSGGVSSWNDLTDKPSAFPPATHNHVIGDVTGLENKLNEKISSVNGQVPNSSGAVTLPVATSKADGLMSAADKEKLDGLDTTGSTGDMLKSVYDTDDDGIVDHAATADAVGATTAAQVADAVGKAHTHANKTTLDKLAEADGKLTYDGAEIGGGSGTVKSVNGQLPDESGNVTVETGGAVDESRLLPETGSVSSDSVGNPVIFKAISRIDNTYWLCLPLNEDTNDRSTYDVATEVYGTVNIVSNAPSSPGGSAFFNGSSCLHGTLPAQFGASDFTVRFWMMAPTISSSSQTIFSTRYGDQTDASTFALLCTTEGRLFIYSNGDITSRTDTPFTLQPSVWYHVAVVRKSGVLTIYVNGEVYNSATFTNSLTRQIFGLGASWTGSSYSEAGTVYLTSLDVLNYAAYDGAFTTPAYQPGILAGAGYEVATDDEVKNMLSTAGIDESRLLPENPANGDIPCFDATATIGGGNDANTRILLHFDADEIKDEAAGNAAPVTITKKTGTITVVEGGKWGKCAKYVTGSMTVATNLDELNANNWVVSGWFNPDENNHGVSYPVWLSMDDSSTNGFFFDSTGRYGESDGPLFYLDTPPASGTWHWLAIVKYSGGLRFYLNGAFLNEISAQQRANFCSTLAIGGFAGTYAAGSTERTFSGLVDEVRLQYIPDDEITLWTGTSIAVPDAPYSKPQTVGEWGKFNKADIPILKAKPVDGNLMAYTTQTFNVSDTMHLLHFDDPDQWFKDETGNYTGDTTRQYYAFSTDIKKFGNGGLQYQNPNGTADYKSKVFNISGVYPLKGPQDDVTVELWFYVDQPCVFEVPSIMAKKGTSSNNWNFWLTHKTVYVNDVAVAVDDVARLSYHNFDDVSLHDEVEVPYSRPSIEAGWHHFAFCRDAAYNHYMFLDGTMLIKVLGSQFGSSQYLCPIVPDATSSHIDCTLMFDTQVLNYYDELRYSSVCLYTKNFIPPSEPFTYDAGAASKDVTGWFPASPGVIGLITKVNNWMPTASGQLTIPEASESFPGLMSATDKQNLSSEWYTLTAAAAIVLSRSNGALQKVTLTQNCTFTAPVLTTEKPTLLLQVTSSSAVTVTVGSTNIVTNHTGTFQVGWFWDGEATRRYPMVEIG